MANTSKQASKTKKPAPKSQAASKTKTTASKSKSALAKDIGASIDANESKSTTQGAAQRSRSASKPTNSPDTPAPKPVEPGRKSGFAPALLGGALAAMFGFLAARSDILDPVLPEALKSPDFEAALADLRETDADNANNLAALRAEFEALEQPDLAPIEKQLSALQAATATLKSESETQEARLRDLEARLAPLDARLTEVEKRPMTDGASQAAIAAYDRELESLRAAIAAQRSDVENLVNEARATQAEARTLEENAAIAARNAEIRATMTRLLGAVDDGAPYDRILAEISDAGISVPEALTAMAGDGVASLGALANAFPKAARAALSAARDAAGEGGGIAGFFQRQLGARSVRPRDGNDPDAILSRAEAALNDGRLAKTLEELSALPDVARNEMQDWINSAATRLTAMQAADELAQSLNSN